LNTKDISPLLGMTVRSVEMTRYRLRRKLGLSREHNLTDFLQRY
jgi:DNA-binding CsgD family transcriptional regulator